MTTKKNTTANHGENVIPLRDYAPDAQTLLAGLANARQLEDGAIQGTCPLCSDPLQVLPAGYLDSAFTCEGSTPHAPAELAELIEQNARGKLRAVKIQQPDIEQMKEVLWFWEGRISKGAFSLFSGEEGAGKSMVSAWLMARASRGQLPGDSFSRKRGVRVLLVGPEDRFNSVWTPRLLAQNADLSNVNHIEHSFDLTEPPEVHALGQIIRGHGEADPRPGVPYELVIFDAILDHVGRSNADSAREMRTALNPLQRLAQDTGAAIVGTSHLNKGAGTLRQRVSGSQQLQAVARSVLVIDQHPEDEDLRVLVNSKNNLGMKAGLLEFQIESYKVTRESDGLTVDTGRITPPQSSEVTQEDLERPSSSGGTSKKDRAITFLREWMEPDQPRTQADLLARLEDEGISKTAAYDASKALGILKDQAAGTWTLPKLAS